MNLIWGLGFGSNADGCWQARAILHLSSYTAAMIYQLRMSLQSHKDNLRSWRKMLRDTASQRSIQGRVLLKAGMAHGLDLGRQQHQLLRSA